VRKGGELGEVKKEGQVAFLNIKRTQGNVVKSGGGDDGGERRGD
jgi:hypothetical protein